MKTQKRIFLLTLATTLALPTLAFLTGCGADNPPVTEDKAKTQARVDAAIKERTMFDKSGGNYDKLTDDEKKELNGLTGSEAASREAFSKMGNPSTNATNH